MQSAETNLSEAQNLKSCMGETVAQAKMHGAWPIENVAARRGVALSSFKSVVGYGGGDSARATAPTGGGIAAPAAANDGTSASSLNLSGMASVDAIALQQIMDVRATHVDRIEAMPSPYLWEVMRDFERRAEGVGGDVAAVRARLELAEEAERTQGAIYGTKNPLPQRLAELASSQNDALLRIAARAATSHDALAGAKVRYEQFCRARARGGHFDDPFLRADAEEAGREREVQGRILEEQLAIAAAQTPATPAAGTAAPAAGGGLFGAPAPAAAGLFGAPAPATGGGLFGAPGEKLTDS